jgi:hypothetical protein
MYVNVFLLAFGIYIYIRVMVLTCRILAPGAGAGEMPSALNIRYPLIVAELWRRVPRPDHLTCARVNIFPAILASNSGQIRST